MGAIVKAYGFDLSPLAERYEEFVILAHHRADDRRCAHLRRRTIALNTLRQLAAAACAYGVGGRDWPGWLAEAEAIAARCPTRRAASRPALEAVVAELERRPTAKRRCARPSRRGMKTRSCVRGRNGARPCNNANPWTSGSIRSP